MLSADLISLCFCWPGCECCPSFILFAPCWFLSFCLYSPGCECHHLFSLFSLLTSLLLCLCLLECEFSLLFILFAVCYLLSDDFSIPLFLFASLWVQPLVCPVCCLLTSFLLCLCLSACECCLLFVLFSASWPVLLHLFCQYVSTASCLLPALLWHCFLSLLTCNIQEQKVSLLKTFVETVGFLFYLWQYLNHFRTIFPFTTMTYITSWLVLFSYSPFSYFHSCDSHFGACYPSAFFWKQSGLSFTSSPVTIHSIWISQHNPISCSLSRVFKCRVYTIHLKKPSPCKINTFDVNFHLLHDEWGPFLESIFAHMICHLELTVGYIRLAGLSAILPNYGVVATFLQVDEKKSAYSISMCSTGPVVYSNNLLA